MMVGGDDEDQVQLPGRELGVGRVAENRFDVGEADASAALGEMPQGIAVDVLRVDPAPAPMMSMTLSGGWSLLRRASFAFSGATRLFGD
jgi:hypothetical protein